MRIENIFDDAIAFNLERSKTLTVNREAMGAVPFAKEFQTVRINLGRQCGQTTYILRTMTPYDVLFTRYALEMETKIGYWSPQKFHILSSKASEVKFVLPTDHGKVWIDDASFVDPETLKSIYEKYAGHVDQFILVG